MPLIYKFVNGTYHDGTKSYSLAQLKSQLRAISLSQESIIVQSILKNHICWMKFTPGSLATCRIVTAKIPDKEKIIPHFGCFRMPAGESVTDNYSRGGLISPVDLSTGKLGIAVTSTPTKDKFEFAKHPDSQHQIEENTTWASYSYEIPFQDSLKNTVYPELFEKWMEKYD